MKTGSQKRKRKVPTKNTAPVYQIEVPPDDQLPERHPCTPKQIPAALLIDLRKKGLSYSQIGKVVNCSANNAQQRITDLGLNTLDKFRENKAEVYETCQQLMVNALTPSLAKDLIERRGFVDVGILEDKINILRGKTSNINDIVISNVMQFFGGASPACLSGQVGEVIDQDDYTRKSIADLGARLGTSHKENVNDK
jgi:hypothetical protein